ncbi:MAG: STAS domain-containing protein [Acidimicrobiales bacterium]
MLEFTVERLDDKNLVMLRPAGELDAYTVAQFREALAELATEPRVVVELSDVPFMDSAGLGALIGGIRRIRENEGRVAVACGRATLMRLLHTTGFNRIVPVKDTLEEAGDALDQDPDT